MTYAIKMVSHLYHARTCWRGGTRYASMFLSAVCCLSSLAYSACAELLPATHVVIEAASATTPRADTASIVELADGRLIVAYQKYHAGDRSGQDAGYCNIWSKTSDDGGHTWKHPRLLVDVSEGDVNVMNPMLLRLDRNEVILVCHRYHPPKPSTSTAVLLRSTDGGNTFAEESNIWERPDAYRVAIPPLNRLACGRILLAFSNGKGMGPYEVMTTYSDDNAKTWTERPHRVRLPKRGALEPSVAELPDRSLLMSIRTQLGGPYLSRSTDRGVSWSKARFSGLEGGESGTCLRRIPNSDRLVLFFNNSKFIPTGHHHYGERTPLTVAASDDGGHDWRVLGNLAEQPDTEYTNLDCTFDSRGKAILTYMFAKPAWNRRRIDLRAAIIDGDWLRNEDRR